MIWLHLDFGSFRTVQALPQTTQREIDVICSAEKVASGLGDPFVAPRWNDFGEAEAFAEGAGVSLEESEGDFNTETLEELADRDEVE